ncbi:hypothetical protein K443DRAFT_135134 [Laccaria amethystina LaAM-08-1]|uniref:KOW domain-containing protein n=1 Tax=Laccaria amethystina LaAM-08-1 TaxID=1095629 RepID=A0A0C9X5Y3_9AGAR|nr:hypothetical protein K443DRAFT_135134 [Laccaria amethystina LaAM-08-1]
MDGVTSTIPLTSLRKSLKIGDEVRIKSGSHKGFTGWVVNTDEESVWLFNHETAIEIEVSTDCVNLYSPALTFVDPSVTAVQKEVTNDLEAKMHEDPNRYLVGKHVVVTAGSFKNYRGIVKSTFHGGKVLVELEAHLQCQEPFDIKSLRLMMRKIENRDSSLGPSVPSTPSGLSSTSISTTECPILPVHLVSASMPPADIPSTPLPGIEDISTSPAWNPGSHTPNRGDYAPPPYWLAESCFNGMRISLWLLHTNSDVHGGKYEDMQVEFKGVVGDIVRVQDMWDTIEVPFKYLVPVMPSQAGEIVVAFEGPQKGKKFKVMVFKHDVCGCSNWESATHRRWVDVEIPTNHLVVAYP